MRGDTLLIVYAKYVLIFTEILLGVLLVLAFYNIFNTPTFMHVELQNPEVFLPEWQELASLKEGHEGLLKEAYLTVDHFTLSARLNERLIIGHEHILFLVVLGGFLFARLLLKIVKSAENKTFFDMRNVKRIRLIGFGLMAWWLIDFLWYFYKGHLAHKYFESEYLESSRISFTLLPSMWSPFVLGVIVLIIAQAFHHGMKLEKEQELTI